MTEREAPREAARRRRALWLSWLVYASYYLGRKGFSVTKAPIARELGLGLPALAAIDTAFLTAYAAGQVPSGVLSDRFGARAILSLGLLGSALACAAFGAGQGAFALGVCFACNGLVQATGWPASTKVVADHTEPSSRGRVMGLWSTCYQVGGIAATALATATAARWGWRFAFFVPALWLAALSAIVRRALPEAPQRSEATPLLPHAPARASLRTLTSPVLYCYGACYFCIKLIRYSLLFWLPFYLHQVLGFGEAASGYLSIGLELGGVLGTIGVGALSDRAGLGRAQVACGALLGLALALAVHARLEAQSELACFASLAVIGALLFGPDALVSGVAAQEASTPEQAATAVGLVNGLGSAGALFQGVVTVAVQKAFGWRALFSVFLGLSLLAAACLLPALRVRRPRDVP